MVLLIFIRANFWNFKEIMCYKTIDGFYKTEFTERNSRFISHLKNVDSVGEALDFIKNIKLKHKFAKHSVYAYRIFRNIVKFSDDGEPGGTAGAQVLGAMESADLQNAIIVVVRYFGGILLGTGGLSKAYRYSAESVINSGKIIVKKLCRIVEFKVDYIQFYKINRIFSEPDHHLINIKYSEDVLIKIAVALECLGKFKNSVNEYLSKKIDFTVGGEMYL
jgi:uncharacterized YigZ family protein